MVSMHVSQSPCLSIPELLTLSATSESGAASLGRTGGILLLNGLWSSQGQHSPSPSFQDHPGSWLMVLRLPTPPLAYSSYPTLSMGLPTGPGQLPLSPSKFGQGTLLQAGFWVRAVPRNCLGGVPNSVHKPSKETRLGWLCGQGVGGGCGGGRAGMCPW